MRALALALPWTYAIRVGHREGNHCVTSLKHDSRIHRSSMSPNSTNEIHTDKLIPIGFAVLHSSWVPPVPLLPFSPLQERAEVPRGHGSFSRNPEAMPETSKSYATDRNLKLHKCQDVSRAKITGTMAEKALALALALARALAKGHWHWHEH